uniref:BHLH domain-containing protein n=1 Tax=Amazona collaria TaxID=241587 RepID=A0A8B9F6W2_9PSIT
MSKKVMEGKGLVLTRSAMDGCSYYLLMTICVPWELRGLYLHGHTSIRHFSYFSDACFGLGWMLKILGIQVPCYSYGQKLSKLAILRIACNYILSLARLADLDYSADHSNMSFSECVEQCTRTLQAEGRSKKRKE